ncbi:MAG: class I SAM-dependent rRNA methyltransferase [Ruminococcaceae bacterium]|nr:class I SAM-dependent rRNA methyltransferase [Oscillospiraceae bacterium]
MRNYPRLTVTEKAARKAKSGHPWIFGEEVLSMTAPDGTPIESIPAGELTDAYSEKGKYLGTGFYNDHSKIRVRLISSNTNDTFDTAFWTRRISHAVAYRKTVMPDDFASPTGGLRLIFGEADHFPGWTVDRYGPVLVSEVLSAGIDARRDLLYPLLAEACRAEGMEITAIYERCTGNLRRLEGLDEFDGFWNPAYFGLTAATCPAETTLVENGVQYTVDFINGQKTGFFLDQKHNRRAAAGLAKGKRVLDMFTHTGSFGLNCAKGGAASVESVDISADACAMAKHNAAINGVSDIMTVTQADVFDMLRTLAEDKKNKGRWDYIILDPPAFTKSRDTVKSAYRGYREINTLAMRLLPRGGYLATCSCSHFMPPDLFKRMLHEAAEEAHVTLRQIEERAQAPDHPILWNVPETEYLKFYLFQVE